MSDLINRLCAEVNRIEERYEWNSDFLSRWKFENCLDSLAKIIHKYLQMYFETIPNSNILSMGCSLLYLGDSSNYYVGGATRERLRMDSGSRFYKCPDLTELNFNSFTMASAMSASCFILDDFKKAQENFNTVRHTPKVCELPEQETKSFYCIPLFTELSNPPQKVRNENSLRELLDLNDEIPKGLMRLSFSIKNMASLVDEFFTNDFFISLFGILKKGQEILVDRNRNNVLAIADLQADLLKFRNSEYSALNQLAFHLQTLFGNCECSVFLAHKTKKKKQINVPLFLAATSAQSDSDQHKIFRRHFFDGISHYMCHFDEKGDSQKENIGKCGKTELAYYNFNEAFLRDGEGKLRSSRFHGKGEYSPCSAFLAVAIPSYSESSSVLHRLPYGVIRIVRDEPGALDDSDKRLATAVARAMSYWADMFPKNEELKINWPNNDLKIQVQRLLFEIGKFPGKNRVKLQIADYELTWLLQKIFYNCKEITLKKIFSGRSGAIILLVENDNGLDLILKCSNKFNEIRNEKNDIISEIENYEKYIQGKLDLNHNIIYKELVRETRNLIGFATSFLSSSTRNRISLTEYSRNPSKRQGDPDYGRTFTNIVERLTNDVWGWWYEKKQLKDVESKRIEYVNRIINEDSFFKFFNDMESFDSNVFSIINKILRLNFKPSQIWSVFHNWLRVCKLQKEVPWKLTATHGDIHGDNIFFDPESMDMWLIDFARTNVRTSIFDLAMIESDLKFRLIPNLIGDKDIIESDKYIHDFWDFECDLARQENYEELIIPKTGNLFNLNIASKAIVNIRQIAAQKLDRNGDFSDYRFVLLLLAFKNMKINAVDQRKILPYLSSLAMLDSIVISKCSDCVESSGENACKLPMDKSFKEINQKLRNY